MTKAGRKFTVSLAYVALIYASLPFTRNLLNRLRAAAGGAAFSAGVNIFLIAVFLFVLYFVLKSENLFRRLGIFLAVSLVFLFFIKGLRLPEERIHFFEYGLCGILFADAFENTGINSPSGKILFAFAAVFAAGITDELIQKILPSRVFDVRDILFNIVAGGGGVIVEKWALNLNSIK